ncbi:universal stress protein [Kitasatospora sp. A2-31]|uniref:universal stress protein n=1 Tax=Kitasatospora sp. A2-31 TaxID=2916414 RepID=UPI001EED77FE|nr:universal stress protein [Kitasatospora sp. A2-31]MCG6498974.1 universal stress protein [Kitasatospora sp. A2-31]
MAPQPDGRIVVGVDGSPHSHAALRWAARLAALTGGPLEAVTVWDFPSLHGAHGLVLPALDGFGPERRAAAILDETVAAAGLPQGRPAVRRRLKAGPAGPALVSAAAGAAVLVLGRRGRCAPPGARLGTTSQYCVHHAGCTVVLVEGDDPPQ